MNEFVIFLKIENLGVDKVFKRKYLVTVDRPLIVGRTKDCNIVLMDENVSRQHCSFNIKNGRLYIEDLGSGNGTYINGKKVSHKEVKQGQLIVLGGFEVSVMKIGENKGDIKKRKPKKTSSQNKLSPPEKLNTGNLRERSGIDTPLWNDSLSVNGIKNLIIHYFKELQTHKLGFFINQDYDGDSKNSIKVIIILNILTAIVGILLGSNSLYALVLAALGAIQGVLGIVIFAKIMHLLRGWSKADGSYDHYLRYFTILSILIFPLTILALAPYIGQLIGIVTMVIGLIALYYFYKYFKPRIIPFIVVIILSVVASVVIAQISMLTLNLTGIAPSVESVVGEKGAIEKWRGESEKLKEALKEN